MLQLTPCYNLPWSPLILGNAVGEGFGVSPGHVVVNFS